MLDSQVNTARQLTQAQGEPGLVTSGSLLVIPAGRQLAAICNRLNRRSHQVAIDYARPDMQQIILPSLRTSREYMRTGFVQAKRSIAYHSVYPGSHLEKVGPAISHMQLNKSLCTSMLGGGNVKLKGRRCGITTREYVSITKCISHGHTPPESG